MAEYEASSNEMVKIIEILGESLEKIHDRAVRKVVEIQRT